MATKKPAVETSIDIQEVQRGFVTVNIVGTSPFICNRMSSKVKQGLLSPERKTAADKASKAKHDVLAEYRDSPYRITWQQGDNPKTALAILPAAFKQAICLAALRVPGVKKTEIEQLVTVPFANISLYGVPRLLMSVTRSADINKTPDIRTRAIIPEWACQLELSYIKPIMREGPLLNLLAAAGYLSGVGDWRQEKGSGSFGSFRLASADDADFLRITSTMGKEVQEDALLNPVPYDDESGELLAWYMSEMKRRDLKVTQ